MAARFGLASLLAVLLAGSAVAQTTVIVNENFDAYADRAAFLAQWVPTLGNGSSALASSDLSYLGGLLTDDAEFPSAIPDVQGKAVDHVGATATPGSTQVNQWAGPVNQGAGEAPDFTINPSATQNVFLKADIFNGTSGNERMSVGLRGISVEGTTVTTTNLIEMGQWNAATTDPTLPATPPPPALPATNFGARINLFGAPAAPLVRQPDWQYFVLAPELDRTTDTDELTSLADIGAGWHTYTVTISPTTVKFTIDLFRDGKTNLTRTPEGAIEVGVGADGVDGVIEYEIPVFGTGGFNALRVGGPSGLTSAGAGLMGFDNILLQLQASDVVPPGDDADFDGDGDVDGADFLTWQRGLGGPGDLADGDADGDGNVTAADLDVWKLQFGPGAPAAPAVGAVPEPATAALAAAAMLAGLAATRRR